MTVNVKRSTTYWVEIHIAGDMNAIQDTCRRFCWRGLCVTVVAQKFIYTGGQEDGAVIGLINYPRFESDPATIWQNAIDLAHELRLSACQWSVLVMDPDKTEWITELEVRDNG